MNSALANAVDGISLLDPQGRYVSMNPAYARIVGYLPEEMTGTSWEPTVHPEDRDKMRAAYQRMLASGKAEAEARGVRKDGSVFHKQVVMVKAHSADGTVVGHHCFMKDISERKRADDELRQAQEHLRQAQKLEAIGRLAGGIAHDFNNLLTVINGYSEILLSNGRTDEVSRRLLGQVKKSGERAATLTQQLLAFSRKAVIQPVVLDLNPVVKDAEKMLRRLIGEDIELRTELEPGLGAIRADRGQIDQILLNLAVNARDAMPKGGSISVRTRNIILGPDHDGHIEVVPGPYVLLQVTDSGCGMDESTRARIFEPFFTTKEVGKGTGLGLATVYGIVKQNDGYIEVASVPGTGATFRIYLPRTQDTAPVTGEAPTTSGAPQGSGTVLLVEDEADVRS